MMQFQLFSYSHRGLEGIHLPQMQDFYGFSLLIKKIYDKHLGQGVFCLRYSLPISRTYILSIGSEKDPQSYQTATMNSYHALYIDTHIYYTPNCEVLITVVRPKQFAIMTLLGIL